MLVPPESPSAVLVMISSFKSVSICNRSHAIDEPIVVKLCFLKGGVPLFDALVRGQYPHPAAPSYLIRN